MKRLVIFLVALALLAGSLPLFAADVTIKEDFIWFGAWNPDTGFGPTSAVGKARLKFDGKVDDFNSLYIELRAEGLAWNGTDILDPTRPGDTLGTFKDDFYLKQFKLTSDLTGALGLKLPVTVKATLGRWDEYFTGWYYYDQSGWEFYYGGPNQPSLVTGLIESGATWSNKLVYAGETNEGAIKFDVGVMDKVNLHYYQDFVFKKMMFGADVSFMGAGLWLSMGVPQGLFEKSVLSAEAKYDAEFAGFKVGAAPFFRYELGTPADNEHYTAGASVKVAYSWIQLVGGLQGDDMIGIDHVLAELSLTPIPNLEFVGALYLDMEAPNSFQGVDLRLGYKFGAANFIVGWIIGGLDHYNLSIYKDNVGLKNGLYFGADCSL